MVTRRISFENPVIGEGRYNLQPDWVNTKIEGGKIKGEEILYFEGNPDPLDQPDSSTNLLETTVGENYVRQTSGYKKKRIGFNKAWVIVLGLVAMSLIIGTMYFTGYLRV